LKHLIIIISAVILSIQALPLLGQDYFVVKTEKTNVRKKPESKSAIIFELKKGTIVSAEITSDSIWYKIHYYNIEGFVTAKLLIPIDESAEYKNWEKVNIETGAAPECENITPTYDTSINNELKITVESGSTDAIVKLMSWGTDDCIRIAYIHSGNSYSISNIPEGYYYLKTAYGRVFRKYKENGNCVVKFLNEPSYKKGTDKIDFYNTRMPDSRENGEVYKSWSIPSYELTIYSVLTIPEFDIPLSIDKVGKGQSTKNNKTKKSRGKNLSSLKISEKRFNQ